MTRFLIGNFRWLLAGFLMTMGSAFGQTYFVSLSNSALIERFGFSHGSLGLVYALATTSSALILLEFGKIVDRVRARTAAMAPRIRLYPPTRPPPRQRRVVRARPVFHY